MFIRFSALLSIAALAAVVTATGSGHSGQSGQPGHSGQPGQSGQSGQSGHSGQPGQSGQSGHSGQSGQSGQCNTGNTQCCSNTYDSSGPEMTALTSLLGIVLPSLEGMVGLGCTPITGIGASSGATCANQPVCCQGDTFNGLINIGCNAGTLSA